MAGAGRRLRRPLQTASLRPRFQYALVIASRSMDTILIVLILLILLGGGEDSTTAAFT
jgi:hypothetical protein